jgi:hypothetical protein
VSYVGHGDVQVTLHSNITLQLGIKKGLWKYDTWPVVYSEVSQIYDPKTTSGPQLNFM